MKKSNNSCKQIQRILTVSVVLASLGLAISQSRAAELGTVAGDRVNVRARAGKTAEVVAQLAKGDTVEILEHKTITEGATTAEWLRIVMPATAKCYVSAKLVSSAGVATADAVYIRCGPGTNFRDVGKLTKGDKVQVVETKGEWSRIKPMPQCVAWLVASLVKVETAPVPPPAPMAPAAVAPMEVISPPSTAPTSSAGPSMTIVNTDPEIHAAYVVKAGVLQKVSDSAKASVSYQLTTPEVQRLRSRIAYLESPQMNLSRYEGKNVRIFGTERWRKGERDPVIVVERVEMMW